MRGMPFVRMPVQQCFRSRQASHGEKLHTHTRTHARTHSLTHSLTHTHTHTLTQSHTHTHTSRGCAYPLIPLCQRHSCFWVQPDPHESCPCQAACHLRQRQGERREADAGGIGTLHCARNLLCSCRCSALGCTHCPGEEAFSQSPAQGIGAEDIVSGGLVRHEVVGEKSEGEEERKHQTRGGVDCT